MQRLIDVVFILGCYASFWSYMPRYGTPLQVAFYGLFLGASLVGMSAGRLRARPPSVSELIFYIAGILSAVVGLVQGDNYTILYSIMFLMALFTISLVARTLTLVRVLNLCGVASALGVLTCAFFHPTQLMKALSISIGRSGLFRFGPLYMTPDLAGLVLASSGLLVLRLASNAGSVRVKVSLYGVSLLAMFCVLAASARASLLALGIAALAGLSFEWGRRLSGRQKLWIAAVGALASVALIATKARVYLNGMLELSSKYRGVGTGGTGRVELWLKGLHTIVADPIRLAVGGGLRSSDGVLLGFFTENSYVTIMIDSGIFIGGAIILAFCYSTLKALLLARGSSKDDHALNFVFTYLLFFLMESFFNRYLLAIGNPASLMALVIVVTISLHPSAEQKSNAEAPGAWNKDMCGASQPVIPHRTF